MRVEILESRDRSHDSKVINDIHADQLKTRLLSVMNGISNKRYNQSEHKKRIRELQSDFDAVFAVKKVREKYESHGEMNGPAYSKIMAQRELTGKAAKPGKSGISFYRRDNKSSGIIKRTTNVSELSQHPDIKLEENSSTEGQSVNVSKIVELDLSTQRTGPVNMPKALKKHPFKQVSLAKPLKPKEFKAISLLGQGSKNFSRNKNYPTDDKGLAINYDPL